MLFERFNIPSPKQSKVSRSGWDAFFPYYAGYPASFASSLIGSASLSDEALVLDPWNGSGTTTHIASKLGYRAIGCDLNPVMVIVSRARCLTPADGDTIKPLTGKIIDQSGKKCVEIDDDDPLLGWFNYDAAAGIRCIEAAIREYLLGSWTLRPDGTHFECMSSLAATFYVALFLTCRSLASTFQSSNPTWLRRRKAYEPPLAVDRARVVSAFSSWLEAMSNQLAVALSDGADRQRELGKIEIKLADTTELELPEGSVDFVLTSPPYCTRIDYTAATRVELAILAPLLDKMPSELSRLMLGSTRVPTGPIDSDACWGATCNQFLEAVRGHRSKASDGYYLKTHLDYFSKLSKSLKRVALSMKPGSTAIFVVQDSYYKDVHNDLPAIMAEMARYNGLTSIGTMEFRLSRSMSGVNPYTRIYERRAGAVEAVLGFVRD